MAHATIYTCDRCEEFQSENWRDFSKVEIKIKHFSETESLEFELCNMCMYVVKKRAFFDMTEEWKVKMRERKARLAKK